jgi:hypothetical protein
MLRRRRRHQEACDRFADVDGNDVRTLLRQSHRMRAALTARRAGDERDLAFDSPGHNYLKDVWEYDETVREIIPLDPSDVLTAEQAGKLLDPLIKPLPTYNPFTAENTASPSGKDVR